MGIRKKVARAAFHTLAPCVTTRELRQAAAMGAVRWAGRRVAREAGKKAALYAATGFAAVAVTVPVGLYLGRRLRDAWAD